MITIGIDIDGVLRQYGESVNRVYAEVFPHHKDLIIDNKSMWDFFGLYDFDSMGQTKFFKKYDEKIFLEADTYLGTKEHLDWLVDQSHKLRMLPMVITRQITRENEVNALIWLKLNKLYHEHFICVNHFKEKWDYADIMIDDSADLLETKPKGKVSIKVNYGYNNGVASDFNVNAFTEIDLHMLQEAKRLVI